MPSQRLPLWWLAPPPCPVGSVSLNSQTSGRISIGRRLYGQARHQRIRPCVFLCRIRTLRLPTNPVPLPPQLYWGHYGYWAAAAMEIMTVTVITVCAADRRHIYSSPKAIPHPLNPLNPYAQRACPCLPADRYLSPIVSNAACTEILRLRLRMTVPGGKSRNADFILIAKGDTTTLSRKVAVKLQNLKNLRSQRLRQPSRQRRVKRRYHNPQPRSGCQTLEP